jgi:hypothetical protein
MDLEDDSDLQDAMLSVHHAVIHTLAGTGAFKIIENHHGRAFIQQAQPVLQGPLPLPPGALPPGAAPVDPRVLQGGDGAPAGNRAERRAAQRGKKKH